MINIMIKNSITSAMLIFTLVGCLAAREGNDGGSTSRETHWLSLCQNNVDCGENFECICGMCHRACEQAADCSDLSANTVCENAGIHEEFWYNGGHGYRMHVCEPVCLPTPVEPRVWWQETCSEDNDCDKCGISDEPPNFYTCEHVSNAFACTDSFDYFASHNLTNRNYCAQLYSESTTAGCMSLDPDCIDDIPAGPYPYNGEMQISCQQNICGIHSIHTPENSCSAGENDAYQISSNLPGVYLEIIDEEIPCPYSFTNNGPIAYRLHINADYRVVTWSHEWPNRPGCGNPNESGLILNERIYNDDFSYSNQAFSPEDGACVTPENVQTVALQTLAQNASSLDFTMNWDGKSGGPAWNDRWRNSMPAGIYTVEISLQGWVVLADDFNANISTDRLIPFDVRIARDINFVP